MFYGDWFLKSALPPKFRHISDICYQRTILISFLRINFQNVLPIHGQVWKLYIFLEGIFKEEYLDFLINLKCKQILMEAIWKNMSNFDKKKKKLFQFLGFSFACIIL